MRIWQLKTIFGRSRIVDNNSSNKVLRSIVFALFWADIVSESDSTQSEWVFIWQRIMSKTDIPRFDWILSFSNDIYERIGKVLNDSIRKRFRQLEEYELEHVWKYKRNQES